MKATKTTVVSSETFCFKKIFKAFTRGLRPLISKKVVVVAGFPKLSTVYLFDVLYWSANGPPRKTSFYFLLKIK